MSAPTPPKNRSVFEKVTEISSYLILAESDSLDDAIAHSLGYLCAVTGAVQGILLMLSDDRRTAIVTHKWPHDSKTATDVSCTSVSFEISDEHRTELSLDQIVVVSRPAGDLPSVHRNPSRNDEHLGRPFVLFPLVAKRGLDAIVAIYGEKGKSRDWTAEVTAIWDMIRDAMMNAMMRVRTQTALLESTERLDENARRHRTTADETERMYRAIYDNAPVLIHSTDLSGNIISVNIHWLRTLGYAAEEVLGTPSQQYLTKASRKLSETLYPDLLRCGGISDIEAQAVSKTGEVLDVLICAKVQCDAAGAPVGVITSLLNITTRKRAEEAMRLRESYLRAIIENQPGLVWLKDAQCRFLAVNRAFARSCGKNETEALVGKTDLDIWPEELAEKYRKDDAAVMASGVPVRVEELISDKGDRRWFETFKTPVKNARGEIIGTTGYAHDITPRKQEEEALSKVQKLESLGILAGGIAHDFNNLLGGIFGYIDLSAIKTKDKEVAVMLARALGTIDRARGLTQQLLTFAKGGTPIKKAENLALFIQETASFALSGSRVSCDVEMSPDLWWCEIDRNQIEQVIDNIVINAQQAMPDGGTIHIRARNVTFTDELRHLTLAAGDYIKISITDHGIGMPAEILPRIFDPFFSTKNKGHGLGLATGYSIVHRHGGCIDVESEPGAGTTFHLYLPADPDLVTPPEVTVQISNGHQGVVLIMDDEEVIRNILELMLRSLGYSVISTRNGSEAIDVFRAERQAGRPIEAIILDLTVPGGMGGHEAVLRIREIDPRLPVFVASGYADDPVMAKPKEHGFTDSICKPFKRVDLGDVLMRGIDTSTKSGPTGSSKET